jgi:hypothetical protein
LTVILPVVLNGCQACSLTFREQHGLRIFENRVQRKTVVSERNEVTGKWRRLHKEELHDLYSLNIIRVIKSRTRYAGHVTRMGDNRDAYRVLVGKLEENRPLGRPRCR